ncbi:MAG: diguanylate cyclase [Burkholderiaceae bacterium]|nr:diguanylate cyclase [Burkholderiaceae bacterium]
MPTSVTSGAPAAPCSATAALSAFRANRLDDARLHAQALVDAGPAAQRADAATLLARIARRRGKLDQALAESGRAIEAAQAAADPARECRARVQHAHALNALGMVEPALEQSWQARRLAEDSGEPAAEAAAAEALAGVQWAMSRWPEALENFQRMLELSAVAGDIELQAVARGGLAGVEGQLAQLPECTHARAGFERAHAHVCEYLRLATLLGDVHAMRSARHNLAVAKIALGDHAAARRLLEAVLAESDEGEARALSLLNLADLDMEQGHAAAALPRLQTAHALLEASADAGYLQSCCRMLCDAHEALGDARAALDWHRRYHAHHVRLTSERAQMHARALEVQYETGRAQASAEFERLRAERYERAALEDGLTGIANRRGFDQALAKARQRLGDGRPFALALLDLDHFKDINDQHSHQVGDEVLRRVGRLLTASCRRDDVAARYGGEEFALVLADVDGQTARDICERVRTAVEREPWDRISPGLQVRVSIGCLSLGPDRPTHDRRCDAAGGEAGDAQDLLARVDRRLYAAKTGGRNRVVSEDASG